MVMDDDDDNNDGLEIVNLGLSGSESDDDIDDGAYLDSEDEEFQGLLLRSPAGSTTTDATNKEDDRRRPAIMVWNRPLGILMVRGLTILLSLGFLFWLMRVLFHNHIQHSLQKATSSSPSTPPSIDYTCPAHIGKADNDKDGIFDYYDKDTEKHTLALDSHLSLDELLEMKYGSWGITPHQRKALNAHWVHWYADALLEQQKQQEQSNSTQRQTIYESACGVGLTLYVILELLAEQYNITGLEVYGNEYIADDVVTANQFYQQQEQDPTTLDVKAGRLCHGDSTNLTSFVPSNAFDVVLTGYIDPIVDPLELNLTKHQHKKYCKSEELEKQHLMKKEQAIVEDWFAAWAGEMIRIAKPGGTIIVESIALPQCQIGDWGGVAKEWWALAITKYDGSWKDIDPESIEMMEFDPETHYKGLHDRYNVKMVKKKK